MKERKKLCIAGAGGFARETLLIAIEIFNQKSIDYTCNTVFLVKDEDWNEELIMGVPQLKESNFVVDDYEVVLGVGDQYLKEKILNKLPKNTNYTNLIHPNADVSGFVTLGKGIIIASGAVVTCNINIGNHVVIDRQVTIGHDCILNNNCHIAPSVVLSGNVSIEESCYIGTGALIREGISIAADTTIGMGAVVVKNITEKGIYIGNPAKKSHK
tara:strand:- start:2793 stop:3434 length:642 start_codon:yes stop_codon:yes gene_type:complete